MTGTAKSTIDLYRISSRSYLTRAKKQITNNSLESLFYAAFELRCGIEARMQEYLYIQEHISKKKKKGWRVLDLGNNIESAFKTGDKVIILTFYNIESKEQIISLFYTPVTSSLKKNAQKLGNYLHAKQEHHDPNHKWWSDFRELIITTIDDLYIATSGLLLGPPIYNKSTKKVDIKIDLDTDDESRYIIEKITQLGNVISFEVNYLDSLSIDYLKTLNKKHKI